MAVGLVIDGIILVIQYWDEITAFLSNFFTVTVPGLWNSFVAWLGNIPKALGEFFGSLPGKISEWFDNMWQPIRDYDWAGLGYNNAQCNEHICSYRHNLAEIDKWYSYYDDYGK